MHLSEPDRPSDEDDVDPAGQLLPDLENLHDEAVLIIGRIRASVLEFKVRAREMATWRGSAEAGTPTGGYARAHGAVAA
jgi:hypothetical protein